MTGATARAEAPRARPPGLSGALAKCRRHVAFVVLFSGLLNVLLLAPSLYMLQVYDRVLVTSGVTTLVFLSGVLIAALLTLAVLDAARARLLAAASRRIDRLIAPLILSAQLAREGRAAAGASQPLREFDVLRGTLTGPPAIAVIDAPWSPLFIAVCFLIHPWIGWLTVGGGACILLGALFNDIALRRSLEGQQDRSARMYALLGADMANADTAGALGMKGALVRRQQAARTDVSKAQGRAAIAAADHTAFIRFLRLAFQSAVLGLGAYLAIRQQISAGGIIAGSILAARAFAPLEQLVAAGRQFSMARQAFKVVLDVLRSQDDGRTITALPAPTGVLAVENVSVRARSGAFMLRDVSLELAPGEILGVVGPSGAGKTTLLRTIVGALPPERGEVRLDGAKLSDWNGDRLGALVGYMPQEVGLFPGTVADNVSRFSRSEDSPGGSDAAIVAAAKAAGVHDLVLRLPEGYDTNLGANGAGLSAGQAQRIGLARALFGDPVLLALDEPNAHIDAEGEAALIAALQAARARGAAIVVVAHRAGFMRVADKLLVLKDGAVQAWGPRDQVMGRLAAVARSDAGEDGDRRAAETSS
jgi:ATP-binding cassette subfamily C protein